MSEPTVQDLVERRDEIESRKAKLSGKLESAKSALGEIDTRLSEMGLDPSDLDAEIERLRSERDLALAKFKQELEEAEEIITTIEDRIRNL
jgi:chromosome segregation ATPase